MINNNPFAYKSQETITITEIQTTSGSREMAVSCSTPPDAGSAIYVQDTTFPGANGVFIIDSISTVGAFVGFKYTAKYEWPSGTGGTNIYDAARTAIYNDKRNAAIEIAFAEPGGWKNLAANGIKIDNFTAPILSNPKFKAK